MFGCILNVLKYLKTIKQLLANPRRKLKTKRHHKDEFSSDRIRKDGIHSISLLHFHLKTGDVAQWKRLACTNRVLGSISSMGGGSSGGSDWGQKSLKGLAEGRVLNIGPERKVTHAHQAFSGLSKCLSCSKT